jgi:hypothetical protein
VVSNGITVGASAVYKNETGDAKSTPPGSPTTSSDLPTKTTVGLTVVVGYASMFSDNVGIWPYAGVGYGSSVEEDDISKTSSSGPMLGLGARLVLSPAEHFAFTLGPGLSVPVGFTTEVKDKNSGQTLDGTVSGYKIGVGAGLMGWF